MDDYQSQEDQSNPVENGRGIEQDQEQKENDQKENKDEGERPNQNLLQKK
jgi:hypothetical protein